MDRTVYPSEHVVSASKKCVSVYLSVRGTHGMKKEDGKETCSLVPGMTCLEHGAAAKMSKQPGAKVLADRAQAELDKLNASGKAALDKAMEKVAAKEWAAASASLKEVVEQYKGLPVEKDAGKALADATRQEKAEAKNK